MLIAMMPQASINNLFFILNTLSLTLKGALVLNKSELK
ncbi:hypothetical protein P20480_3855 [Pseudoalteromonas sp. BSi20480]|nr:hypothetical protein P20480_3855 [Pseudoalteromonas sp. BSi20480]